MSQLSLFEPDDRPAEAARLAPKLAKLAKQGIELGTSSWKYPGWVGTIYTPSRYETRGKFSQKKFDETCLAEYAETFPVVGGDFSFYQFPGVDYWARLFGGTPKGLKFALKVPEDITVPVWPTHARYGNRGGQANPAFLDAAVYHAAFAKRLLPYSDRIACLMFEFGTFAKRTMPSADAFLDRLDPFLGALPEGLPLSVEIRNPEYLGDRYFEILSRHKVAHVFNAWTRMPELTDQAGLDGAFTADFAVARALLTRGVAYEDAVKSFEPYERVAQVNEGARAGLAAIARWGRERKKPAFLLVNNRLEGHAPGTIEAVADDLLERE
jgi:uncharacterized protein YecE (DUF72 family)